MPRTPAPWLAAARSNAAAALRSASAWPRSASAASVGSRPDGERVNSVLAERGLQRRDVAAGRRLRDAEGARRADSEPSVSTARKVR